jgi:hypothetical protein
VLPKHRDNHNNATQPLSSYKMSDATPYKMEGTISLLKMSSSLQAAANLIPASDYISPHCSRSDFFNIKIERIPHTSLTHTRRTSGHCLGTFRTANFVLIIPLPPNTVVYLTIHPPNFSSLSLSLSLSRPLVREGAPQQQPRKCLKIIKESRRKCWSQVPHGCLTPRQTVGRNITLTFTLIQPGGGGEKRISMTLAPRANAELVPKFHFELNASYAALPMLAETSVY